MSHLAGVKGNLMGKLGSYLKDLFNSILGFHYLLPVTALILILILGAALYNVSVESGYMREQLREDFNEQQLILARQAALRIDEELNDITAEMHRLNNELAEAPPSASAHTYMRTTLDYTYGKGLKEIGRISAQGKVLESVRTTEHPLLQHSGIAGGCLTEENGPIVLGPLQVRNDAAGNAVVVGLLCSPMQGKRFQGQIKVKQFTRAL